jgi:6-phosphogluconolactonase
VIHFHVENLSNAAALTETVAARWLNHVAQAKSSRSYYAALSGGRVTQSLFKAITRQALAQSMPLQHVHFFWADERCVSPTDSESNYRVAAELLFAPLGIPAPHVHRILGELDPDDAAAKASAEVRATVPFNESGQPVFDLVFLGMGEDGHVASLFPGEAEEAARDPAVYRSVVATKPPPKRITLGFAALAAARDVWVLISSAGKEAALRESIAPNGQTPLSRVLKMRKNTSIITDSKAL